MTQSGLNNLPFGILIMVAGLKLRQVNRWLAERLPGGNGIISGPRILHEST